MKPLATKDLRAGNGGYWYRFGSITGWRKGTKPEVEVYLTKLVTKLNKRLTKTLSWRDIARARCINNQRKG